MDLTLAICIYNAEKYIEETLESVSNQTLKDFHLLIINDASTDNSVKVIENYFKENPRQYELINLQENKGICHARYYAERYTKTKYLMFIDADDILLPSAIETMWEKINSERDLIAVGCYLDYIDKNGKKIGGGLYLGETDEGKALEKAEKGKLFFMQPTAIYDRTEALRVGGYEISGFPDGKPRYQDYCEDLDLWTRMSDLYTEGKAIVVVPEVLALYRKGGGLSTNSFPMMLKMKYTKTNVKRRRAGKNNLTFTDFYNSLSTEELNNLKKEAQVADDLRNGVFFFKSGNLIKGFALIGRSFLKNPNYFFDKLRNNLFKSWKS